MFFETAKELSPKRFGLGGRCGFGRLGGLLDDLLNGLLGVLLGQRLLNALLGALTEPKLVFRATFKSAVEVLQSFLRRPAFADDLTAGEVRVAIESQEHVTGDGELRMILPVRKAHLLKRGDVLLVETLNVGLSLQDGR